MVSSFIIFNQERTLPPSIKINVLTFFVNKKNTIIKLFGVYIDVENMQKNFHVISAL